MTVPAARGNRLAILSRRAGDLGRGGSGRPASDAVVAAPVFGDHAEQPGSSRFGESGLLIRFG
jgi:hypothetical protein